MTGPETWPLDDPRTPEQIRADGAAAGRQVNVLTTSNGDDTTAADEILERIRQRQGADSGTPFVVSSTAGGSRRVLIRENQLVVRTDPATLSRTDAFADYQPRERARRRTHVLHAGGKDLGSLQRDVETLRSDDVTANVNPIMPLGYVVKGDSFPEPTVVTKAAPDVDPDEAPVRVAIIDTGGSPQTRRDGWLTGVESVNGTDELNIVEPLDRNDWFAGHGTFTTGIVRQVAPRAEIVVYRFTKLDGLGTDADAADMFIQAAEDADRDGRRLIINASFGAPAVNDVPPLALQDAIEEIRDRFPDVLIVASAGNDGIDEPLYPAAFNDLGVKAVGALDYNLEPAEFSNRGEWVDCSAVGVGLVSTFVKGLLPPEGDLGVPNIPFEADDTWAIWSGTSFTAPQISAAVADLCSQNSELSPQAAYDQLIADRRKIEGFGTVVHIMRGTPATPASTP